jgi:transposase
LLPECLDDYIGEYNPVRVIDLFVDELDLASLGFGGAEPALTGRPGYHPSILLKIYIYGYLNRIQSIRRLERESQRNVELMWLTGRLTPDFKTIADFRRDNGKGIRNVCRRFVALCRLSNFFQLAEFGGRSPHLEHLNWKLLTLEVLPFEAMLSDRSSRQTHKHRYELCRFRKP